MSRDRRPRRNPAPDAGSANPPAPPPASGSLSPPFPARAARTSFVLYIVLASALLAAGFVASPWTWGIHALAFLPRFVWFAAAAGLGAVVFRGPARRLATTLCGAAAWILSQPLRVGALAIVAGVGFFFLRLRFPFLGDGIVWIDKIENGDTFFHFEPLATAVATFVARRAASPRAAAGYPAIVCGVLYVVGIAWLVRRVWSDSRPQALAALLLAIHPTILLFFGYIESYPMLLVLQTGFALTLASRAGWWSLIGSALFLGVAIASHLQSLAWLPALWVAAWMAPGGGRAARWGRELATTAIALGVAALVVRALGPSPLALLGKLRGATGMSGVDAGVLFAPYRSAEMLNEIVLILAPQLLVLGPALAAGGWRRERIAAPWPALAALLPGPLLFFILVPARIGGARDWDLYSCLVLPVTLLGVELWRRLGTAPRAVSGVIAGRALGFALVATIAWLAVQLDTPRAARRLVLLQRADGPFTKFARGYANETLGIYYRNVDTQAARDAYARAVEASPKHARYLNNLANSELALNHLEAARDAFRRALEAGMHEWFVLYNLSLLELQLGDPARAEQLANDVVRGWPRRPEGWASLAQVELGTSKPAAALASIERAIALAPRNPNLLYLRGVAFRDLGAPDRARADWQAALQLDPQDQSVRQALAALPPPGSTAPPLPAPVP